jgi:hypothetical protein
VLNGGWIKSNPLWRGFKLKLHAELEIQVCDTDTL